MILNESIKSSARFLTRGQKAVELRSLLVPGSWVRHPGRPDWGPGQVQSVIGRRVTVNFENAGKRLIMTDVIELAPLDESRPALGPSRG